MNCIHRHTHTHTPSHRHWNPIKWSYLLTMRVMCLNQCKLTPIIRRATNHQWMPWFIRRFHSWRANPRVKGPKTPLCTLNDKGPNCFRLPIGDDSCDVQLYELHEFFLTVLAAHIKLPDFPTRVLLVSKNKKKNMASEEPQRSVPQSDNKTSFLFF